MKGIQVHDGTRIERFAPQCQTFADGEGGNITVVASPLVQPEQNETQEPIFSVNADWSILWRNEANHVPMRGLWTNAVLPMIKVHSDAVQLLRGLPPLHIDEPSAQQ